MNWYSQNLLKGFLLTNYGSGIILPDTRKEINFIKHVLSKVIYYFGYKTADLKQPVFQDISEQGTAVYYDHQKITVKFVIKKASNLK